MKIIKRNGAEVPFDITKIITAVTKASDSVGGQARLIREQITPTRIPPLTVYSATIWPARSPRI